MRLRAGDVAQSAVFIPATRGQPHVRDDHPREQLSPMPSRPPAVHGPHDTKSRHRILDASAASPQVEYQQWSDLVLQHSRSRSRRLAAPPGTMSTASARKYRRTPAYRDGRAPALVPDLSLAPSQSPNSAPRSVVRRSLLSCTPSPCKLGPPTQHSAQRAPRTRTQAHGVGAAASTSQDHLRVRIVGSWASRSASLVPRSCTPCLSTNRCCTVQIIRRLRQSQIQLVVMVANPTESSWCFQGCLQTLSTSVVDHPLALRVDLDDC